VAQQLISIVPSCQAEAGEALTHKPGREARKRGSRAVRDRRKAGREGEISSRISSTTLWVWEAMCRIINRVVEIQGEDNREATSNKQLGAL